MIQKTSFTLAFCGILALFALISGCKSGATQNTETAANTPDPGEILEVGQKAPPFKLQDQYGETHGLNDYKGRKNLVLVFYPGDDTPGCTTQLCAVRDDWADFLQSDVAVLGVNPANAQSHADFVEKFGFPFPLLVDSRKEMIRAYGAEGKLFTQRTVYGIDKNGTIVFAQRGMPANNAILAAF